MCVDEYGADARALKTSGGSRELITPWGREMLSQGLVPPHAVVPIAGVVLAMEPGPEFRRGGRRPGFFPVLRQRLRNSKSAVWLLCLLSMALVVPTVLTPVFSKILVDEILIKHNDGWFKPLLIGMAVAAACKGLMTAFQQSLLLRLQTKLTVIMVSRFVSHVLTLPMEFLHRGTPGTSPIELQLMKK